MARRPGRELEQLPHYVYVHLDKQDRAIYVGRTAHPDTRPWDDRRRKWITPESSEVLVSPAMSFEAAAWMETALIRTCSPQHNRQRGQAESPAAEDWRIDRLCEAENVTRSTAKWAVQYYPTDPDEFEAFLIQRTQGAAALAALATDIEPRSPQSEAALGRRKAS